MSAIRKDITLPEEQIKWLEKNCISLSKFVQAKIREEMNADKS